jgi:hypothetical protein
MKKIKIYCISLLLLGCGNNKQPRDSLKETTPIGGCSSKKEYVSDPTPQWVERVNKIALPDYMQRDSLINVYFKYNQTVNGYEVTSRWMPYDKLAETGNVVINFHHKEKGTEFQYFGEKYHSFDTDDISFAKDFKGHKNGDIHYFNYTSPDTIDIYKEYNDNSPIGYYSSFQFLDVDFDGNDELLISDMCKGRAGNNYEVYKLSKDGLQKVTYMPLDGLTNMDKIDLKNKTITIYQNDGAYDEAEFFFSFKKRRVAIKDIPKFYSASASYFDFDKYNKELGSPFVLDSIKEYTKTDSERRVTYQVRGSRLVKNRRN